ncbi:hypothetical protein F5Y04DRAFT_201728 [Hypomontagnella monticulosa]|nr:hypothetical protein F5Y04DRAFT_201728 [Hypomontagnella monticulosa]
MSGAVELVSLALAVFPLVISLLEHYEDGYHTLGDWVFFRREFTQLVNNLNREQIIFRQHIEGMLRSITDSEYELKEMMEDVNSSRWASEELVSKLKSKLSGEGEYENYNSSIEAIHVHLMNMKTRLDRCRPPINRSNDSNSKGLQLQRPFRKLQFALRKNKWREQVENLGREIDRVDKLFSEAEALAPARQSKASGTTQVFRQTKSQASSLYKAISKGWGSCKCQTPHTFKLLMNRRSHKKPSEGLDSHVLKVSFPQTAQPWPRGEISLDMDGTWWGFNTTMINSTKGYRSPATPDIRDDLRSVTESSCRRSSGTDTTEYMSSVGSQDTPNTRYETDPFLAIPNAPDLIEDLCRALQENRKTRCLGYISDGQGAYHVLNANPTLSFTSAEVDRVISLASVLDQESTRIKSLHKNNEAKTAISGLGRAQRMSIALTLAYAMLELYPTPWLPQIFGKTDVYFFVRKDGEIILESPFLLCKDSTNQGSVIEKNPSMNRDHSNALLALGIMIMELWFGQSIESRPFWKEHCDEKGNEKTFTSFTAAIEWQKKAIDEAGIILHDVTYRCVRGIAGPTTINLDDSECVRAIFDQVIRPLEGLMAYCWPA